MGHPHAGDRARADAALQARATRVLEPFGNYDTTRPFLPWALTIARRALSDARRRQRRFPVALSPAAEEALAAALSPAAEPVRAHVDPLHHSLPLLRDPHREPAPQTNLSSPTQNNWLTSPLALLRHRN